MALLVVQFQLKKWTGPMLGNKCSEINVPIRPT
jgi:hypothetical protein